MIKQCLFIAFVCHMCKNHQFTQRKSLHRHYLKMRILPFLTTKGKPYYTLSSGFEITKDIKNATITKYSCPSCNDLLEDLDQLGQHLEATHLKEICGSFIKETLFHRRRSTRYDIDLVKRKETVTEDLDNDDFTSEDCISECSESLPIIKPALMLEMPSAEHIIDRPMKKLRTYEEAITHACQQKGSEQDKNKTIFILDNLSVRPFAILDDQGNEENALVHSTIINKLVLKHDSIKPIVPTRRPYEHATHEQKLLIGIVNPSGSLRMPVSLEQRDGKTLIIGTQVSNALVTSSIRLDGRNLVSVGGMSSNFQLCTFKDSLTCKIFIDLNSLKSAKVLIEDPSATCVSDIGIISHGITTGAYAISLTINIHILPCSWSNNHDHTCHPFSLFTLAEFDRGRSPCASIFRTIVDEVLTRRNKAKLDKENVVKWIKEATGKGKEILTKVLGLYEENNDSLSILFNIPLNKELEELAVLLMPTIVSANTSIESQVNEVFEIFS
ncbi:uncharacterized protein BX663DRAFT_545122 [Cokeromyces recurvatus]|uniref:uncharacterized protein n=1 Tax=Cokeromyces recurvatus TaxID=90255 RepID=UPI00221F4DE7|nr:uncharacterized protein BX663DRAFT_489496 [Cokeromyces recurvatus]XP_051380115.1 uncharacterized protein BX663DRAFT_545122 [Cokeromyces recurvatus]KAI7899156.1 hypothetical protein BX663DRAFT_489496 [Cokeromyces recurvatus]KAI7900130.1 hypothetical protein BX663DRAFT_545122 [Cokeromyces recurvatus]